ncbi:hypothetical protein JKF63_06563 [Porcisia hertigi]|uniref:Flagellar attachment zone protein 1 conserved domain-containing protein n=1 Tax=Porcisia hertigi TaxID=2761500 RepID=A0A836I934_9TRYP|nr:hypothetical protein JKF63_06563 [Porcisia hertigi]
MTTMKNRDADLYSDVADVLGMLRDTLAAYMSSLRDDGSCEPENDSALGSAFSSFINTSAASELSSNHQYITKNIPRLLDLCSSVQCRLNTIASLTCQSPQIFGTESSSVSKGEVRPAPTATHDGGVACALVTRRLGDVMENAHMMRGLVKLQQQQQTQQQRTYKLRQRPSHSAFRNLSDDNEGPLRMEQLIRVMMYNLGDTEQLLRIAYPEDRFPRERAREGDCSLSLNSPVAHHSPSYPSGRYEGPNSGGADREGSRHNRRSDKGPRDSTCYGHRSSSSSSSDVRRWRSSPVTPRSSVDTTPYVRHSSSLDRPIFSIGRCATPSPVNLKDNSEAPQHVRAAGTSSLSQTGAHSAALMLAMSGQADSSSSLPSTSLAQKSPPQRMPLASAEPSDCDDHDSAFCETVLGDTATPERPLRARDDLLSNPVVRRGSANIDNNGRSANNCGGNALLSLQRLNSGVGCSMMQLAPFGPRRSSLTSLKRSTSSSGSTISTTLTEIEKIDTSSTPLPHRRPELANSATASILTMNTGLGEVPRTSLKTTTPRASTTTAHRSNASVGDWDSADHRGNGDRVNYVNHAARQLGGGDVDRALPPCLGLPPRSPRQQSFQGLAPGHASVDPNARMTTTHTQRLPGELWGVIMADHCALMEDVLREEVTDLFNYGETMTIIRSEDVRDVCFTAVGSELDIRIQLEHYPSLSEAEINMRLSLCAYPHMEKLYEEFFVEYQAKEFDSFENSTTTPGSATPRCTDVRSGSSSSSRASSGRDAGETRSSHGSVEKCPLSITSDQNAADSPSPYMAAAACTSPSLINTEPSKISIASDAATALNALGVPSQKASTKAGTEDLRGAGAEAFTDDAPTDFVAGETETLFHEKATEPSVSRHPHTVRIPGAHWERLLASSVPEKGDLKAAFVRDTGLALGVLPSEARATCQEVLFWSGSLVVSFVWDNAELYPGSVPLSAPAIDTALQKCLFQSVRALYASACAAFHLDNDLAMVPAAKHPNTATGGVVGGGGGGGGGGVGIVESPAAHLDPPSKSKLRLAYSEATKMASNLHSNTEKKEVAEALKSSWECGPPTESSHMPAEQDQSPGVSSAAVSKAASPQQRPQGAPMPSFNRYSSPTSNTSLEALPRVTAPQPMAGPTVHPPKAQLPREKEGSPVSNRRFVDTDHPPVSAASPSSSTVAVRRVTLKNSAESTTLNKLAPAQRAPESVLCQRNPTLAERGADTDTPTPAAGNMPHLLLSSTRARGQAEASGDSTAGHRCNQTDTGVAAVTSTTPRSHAALLQSSRTHPSAKATPSTAPKPPAPAIKQEEANISTTTTTTTLSKKNSTPAASTSSQQPPLSIEHLQKHRLLPTSSRMPTEPLSALAQASAVVLPGPVSSSSALETQEVAAAQGGRLPATVQVAGAPDAAYTTGTAPLSFVLPAPTAGSTRKVSQSTPHTVASTTSSTSRDRAPSVYTVYQLSTQCTTQAGQPRGIEAIWATHSVNRVHQDGTALKEASAATNVGAVVEDHTDNKKHDKALGSLGLLWVQELGLQLNHLTVVQVRRDSAAARANMQPGDTLRAMEGQILLSQRDFLRAVVQQQQQLRKGGGERLVVVTAVTNRGRDATYRLCIPPLHHDKAVPHLNLPSGAGVQPMRKSPPVSRDRLELTVGQKKPKTPRRARSVSAGKSIPAGCGSERQQQQRGLQRPTQKSPRAPARKEASVSARTRVNSIGASVREGHARTSRSSVSMLRHTEAPDMVYSSAAGPGGARMLPQSPRGTYGSGSLSARMKSPLP